MFEEPTSRFGLDFIVKDQVAVRPPPTCDFTVAAASPSITGSIEGNGHYVILQGTSLVSEAPIHYEASIQWLKNLFAHNVGQAATYVALSFGEVLDVRYRTGRLGQMSQIAAPDQTLALVKWLEEGEAPIDVPAFQFWCEERGGSVSPSLVPLSGQLLQFWQAEH